MKQQIIITGGTGYIGSHTVLTLIKAGYKPIIVDNLCNSQPWILTQLEKLSGQKIKNNAIDCTNLSDLEVVFKNEPGYFGWLMHGDFPKSTKKVFKDIMDRMKANAN